MLDATWKLVQSLKLLAAEPQEQMNALPQFVHKPDELALIFDECCRSVFTTLTQSQIHPEVEKRLREIDRFIDEMSGPDQPYWTEESVWGDQMWSELRSMAASTLVLMGEALGRPDLSWIGYVG